MADYHWVASEGTELHLASAGPITSFWLSQFSSLDVIWDGEEVGQPADACCVAWNLDTHFWTHWTENNGIQRFRISSLKIKLYFYNVLWILFIKQFLTLANIVRKTYILVNDFNDKRIIQELRDRFMVVYHIRIFRIENRVSYVKFLHFLGVNSNELLSSLHLQGKLGSAIQNVWFRKC